MKKIPRSPCHPVSTVTLSLGHIVFVQVFAAAAVAELRQVVYGLQLRLRGLKTRGQESELSKQMWFNTTVLYNLWGVCPFRPFVFFAFLVLP